MIKKETIADNIGTAPNPNQETLFNAETPAIKESFFEKIFDVPTGKGSVEEYDNHPLNFTGTRGMSRILRGLTGILGDLDKAIVDIIIGFFTEIYNRIMKKPKGKIKKTKITSDDLSSTIL